MNAVHAYLIDLDGTLADTSNANYLAYSGALQEVGISLNREQFDNESFGKNWRQFLPGILSEHRCTADPFAIASRKKEFYKAAVGSICFNEALVCLLENKSTNVKAGLVTSASSANVHTVFSGRQELRKLFDAVVTGDDVTRHKPDPEGYFIAARRLGVSAENCLVFEDSELGVRAGQAFGAPVLKICF